MKICDFKISVESIACAVCLLRSSPNLYEIEIDKVVKVKHIMPNKDIFMNLHLCIYI
ncbi:hypothetical protein RDI58_012846 [Solanum bulbocastanum]|uniref:Uncharacterized protein n=1 Tax=Solanum bulbocastanum TaxID=147425 RepID=A0AAN8TPK5_SOLBU